MLKIDEWNFFFFLVLLASSKETLKSFKICKVVSDFLEKKNKISFFTIKKKKKKKIFQKGKKKNFYSPHFNVAKCAKERFVLSKTFFAAPSVNNNFTIAH